MAGLMVKKLGNPDETRSFQENKGKLELFRLDGATVGRMTAEPGWRWSTHVGPLTGTGSCQVSHVGTCVSGRMQIVMDDGERAEIGPGDSYSISPGHDAWVIGNERFVAFDFGGMKGYATRARGHEAEAPPPVH